MAKIVLFRDDIDGTDTPDVRTRKVMFEEGTLEIDLSDANYAKLMNSVRRTLKAEKPETFAKFFAEKTTGNDENTVIREWARANGFPDLSNRGRLPQDVADAYRKSQSGDVKSDKDKNADTAANAVNELVSA